MYTSRPRVLGARAPHWREYLLIASTIALTSVSVSAAGLPARSAHDLELVGPAHQPVDDISPDVRALPWDGDSPASFLPPAETLEMVVRKAYARLEELTNAAGEGVEISLSDFHNLRHDELDE
ncbi:MAG TPA: hypothetical protein VF100_04835, partial [Thermoanaerobaculia bacterium]